MNNNSAGGFERARVLDSEKRKEISRNAAIARWDRSVPEALHRGTLNIGDVQIGCAVVEIDGEIKRLIVQREVVFLLTGNKKGGLDRYFQASNLQEFVPSKFKLDAGQNVIDKKLLVKIDGRVAYCYDGEDIIDILDMYLSARRAGAKMSPSQVELAKRAEIIMRSFAKVGIVGLIDEATGYQEIRAKDALQAYLATVLKVEISAWVKQFPNEFFTELYRLKGWKMTRSHHKPGVIGHYINNIVYQRLGPGILEALRQRNPVRTSGNRAAKHHQYLTEEHGLKLLAQHLHSVTTLMRISEDWDQFTGLLERAFPKSTDQLPLPFKD